MSNKKLFGTEHQTTLAQSNCNNESDSSKGTRVNQSQDIPQRQNYQKGSIWENCTKVDTKWTFSH